MDFKSQHVETYQGYLPNSVCAYYLIQSKVIILIVTFISYLLVVIPCSGNLTSFSFKIFISPMKLELLPLKVKFREVK